MRVAAVAAIAALLLGLIGSAQAQINLPRAQGDGSRDGILRKPDGEGPFPAVIVLHTCAGLLGPDVSWAGLLRDEGYVALAVDSFTRRGVKSNCGHFTVGLDEVAEDALAALEHLRTLPYVDAKRVGVMGFSYGASAALRLSSAAFLKRRSVTSRFLAAVAFYPDCTYIDPRQARLRDNLREDVVVPVLILLSGKDEETPSAPCVGLAERLRKEGRPVSYRLFPDATHAFDRGGGRPGYSYRYDRKATDDAWEEARAHLDRFVRRAGS